MEETVEKGGVVKKKGNILKSPVFFGTVGLVFAFLSLWLSWIPILNLIILAFGMIFSLIGVFFPRKGYAIAGLIISHFSALIIMLSYGW